jgi:hypothetical protein
MVQQWAYTCINTVGVDYLKMMVPLLGVVGLLHGRGIYHGCSKRRASQYTT